MVRVLLAFTLLSYVSLATAQERNCAVITNPAERLDCYDSQTAPTPAAVDPMAPSAPARNSRLEVPTPSVVPHSIQGPSSAPEQDKGWLGGALDWRDPVRIESTIKALRRRDTQNMIFLLDNEQIWLQDAARPLPFREGEKVTITSGAIGGFFMTAENGTKTRVRRIK